MEEYEQLMEMGIILYKQCQVIKVVKNMKEYCHQINY